MGVVGEGGDVGGRRVRMGSRVRVWDGYGEVEFMIVSEDAEGSAGERSISVESPLGKALLGRQVGDEVMVRTRTGTHFLRIRDLA